MGTPKRIGTDWALNLGYRAVLRIAMALPYERRVRFFGRVVSRIAGLAGWRKRIRDNLALIWPDLPAAEVARLERRRRDRIESTLSTPADAPTGAHAAPCLRAACLCLHRCLGV